LFWRHVRRDPNGCWLWLGAEGDGHGYGLFNSGGGTIAAHVFAFTLANPDVHRRGLVVRHTCDVKLCVNPKHLIIGTQKDNVRDMDERGRRRSNPRLGDAHANAKLTSEIVLEARCAHQAGASISSLADRFGVSKPAMTSAIRGKTWRSV
jgi:hypothetical protein